MKRTLSLKQINLSLVVIAMLGAITLGATLAYAAHDTDGDGFVSVLEGVPFYGGIAYSLTTEGDASPGSALALDRFPVADERGVYTYTRTFMLDEGENDPENFHVVVHGIDLNNNGVYDGEKESSIAPGVPFEATVPSACGVVEMNGKSGTYKAKINELNSTGVHGNMLVKKDGNEITVKMKVKGVSPDIAHAQHFHAGGQGVCPPNSPGVAQAEYNQ